MFRKLKHSKLNRLFFLLLSVIILTFACTTPLVPTGNTGDNNTYKVKAIGDNVSLPITLNPFLPETLALARNPTTPDSNYYFTETVITSTGDTTEFLRDWTYNNQNNNSFFTISDTGDLFLDYISHMVNYGTGSIEIKISGKFPVPLKQG
jgi:hypothetical protein